MVISHRHRLIFWKPHKVGSTSVMVALGAQCSRHDSVGGVADTLEQSVSNYRRNMCAFSHLPTFGNHATPAQMASVVSVLWGDDLWDQYTKVTIIRNPWARAVSWWDYSNAQLKSPLELGQALHNSERAYWFDSAGQPAADIYLRCECLAADYARLCDTLNIDHQPLPTLRKGQRDPAKPYWAYYDAATRDEVARNFALEIDYFGYRFGDPA